MEIPDALIEELRGEIGRSTQQVIAMPDPAARYLLPQDIVTEVLKYVRSECLIANRAARGYLPHAWLFSSLDRFNESLLVARSAS